MENQTLCMMLAIMSKLARACSATIEEVAEVALSEEAQAAVGATDAIPEAILVKYKDCEVQSYIFQVGESWWTLADFGEADFDGYLTDTDPRQVMARALTLPVEMMVGALYDSYMAKPRRVLSKHVSV